MEVSVQPLRILPIRFSFLSFNPNDSTTYHIGDLGGVIPNAASLGRFRVESCVNGRVTRIRLSGNFAAGTAEASTFELHNISQATSASITTTFSFASAANFPLVVTGLTLAVNIGDQLELRLITPAWVTNPTALQMTVWACIELN